MDAATIGEAVAGRLRRASAACPKTGEGLKDVRWRDMQLITVSGVVNLRVRHGYSPALGRGVAPVRYLWGLKAYQRLSPELESGWLTPPVPRPRMRRRPKWPRDGAVL